MKKKSTVAVGKRATGLVLGSGVVLKRQWFVREGGRKEQPILKTWREVESFCSWNDNEHGLALYLDPQEQVFLVGGNPYVQQLNYVEAMTFLGDMFHQSKEGGDGEAMQDFYYALAATLRGVK